MMHIRGGGPGRSLSGVFGSGCSICAEPKGSWKNDQTRAVARPAGIRSTKHPANPRVLNGRTRPCFRQRTVPGTVARAVARAVAWAVAWAAPLGTSFDGPGVSVTAVSRRSQAALGGPPGSGALLSASHHGIKSPHARAQGQWDVDLEVGVVSQKRLQQEPLGPRFGDVGEESHIICRACVPHHIAHHDQVDTCWERVDDGVDEGELCTLGAVADEVLRGAVSGVSV
mmetsp:Transcript_5118/g.18715  ORF Transcript_5118/g.18715 Transcript_5118/m.18715 type:complete len:227 (-) Transcript_5118:597-1277(-)